MIIKAAVTPALMPRSVAATATKLGPVLLGNPLLVGLRLRGGGATSAAPILKDFGNDVAGYFGGIRTPASLILGASLGALFTDMNDKEEMLSRSRAERLCTRLYNTCVLLSFMLSLTTVVNATAAGVTVMHATFDPVAESAYNLLMREFEFEFITTRLSYLSSLLSFIVGITGRVLLEYKLLHKQRREEAYVVCFGMAAIVTHLWSYINSTLYSSQSLVGLALRLGRIIIQRAMHEHRPLQIISLGCSAITVFFLLRVLFYKKKGKVEDVIL